MHASGPKTLTPCHSVAAALHLPHIWVISSKTGLSLGYGRDSHAGRLAVKQDRRGGHWRPDLAVRCTVPRGGQHCQGRHYDTTSEATRPAFRHNRSSSTAVILKKMQRKQHGGNWRPSLHAAAVIMVPFLCGIGTDRGKGRMHEMSNGILWNGSLHESSAGQRVTFADNYLRRLERVPWIVGKYL